ncbi:MAG: glycosyltransferase, partial [Elainellaceae cyanobacterium]
ANLSQQEARKTLGWPSDRFILFTPRRLVHRMGLDKLLTAISRLGAQKQDVWLAIAGKGPLRGALEAQVEALDLHQQVRFLGYLPDDDLPTAYQAADLTVMPSQALEGFGLVILESLACGTPALCTPVGGMPEIISGFSPELITSSADADAIGTTLKAALNGSITLPANAACRDYATTHFNWPTIADRVEQVLLETV